ncbi:MAG: hypothetical protein EHM33_00020 [Chloroflexi bacterium]|nr:MAG: hypothetical protein EHM33_00020 [Chloroflexota bacterium]
MPDNTALIALGLPIIKDRSEQALAIIRGRHIEDPKLYEALVILAEQVGLVTRSISPITRVLAERVAVSVLLEPPYDFDYVLTGTTIRLSWVRPSISGILLYEIRFGAVNWDSSDFVVRTASTSVDVNPFTGLVGTYRIKSINDQGIYSELEDTVVVNVIPPGPTIINASVIDNNILLAWTDPIIGSFNIEFYSIYRDGVFQGTTRSTFLSFFEVVSGTYKYGIVPVDIANNVGSVSEVELVVNQPPDYVLQDEHVSSLNGVLVNGLRRAGPSILVCVAFQNWQVHFTSRFWLDPEDQVTAGYPIYIQPAELTASYEEIVDYEVVLSNVIAVVRYNTEMITAGDCDVFTYLSWSSDNVTYTPFTPGASQFIPTMRYLKVRLEFESENDKVLMRLFNLTMSLSVKRENDGGEAPALVTDVDGSVVYFTKAFKDVESITATVLSPTEPFTVIVDFVDIPNPTFFKVYVFDTTGNRVSKTIEWKARGVV